MTMNQSLDLRPWRSRLVPLLVAATAGCFTGAETPDESAELAQQQANPNVTHFADVRANGSGCPPGTTSTSISSDGLVFTTTFSSYITQVDPSADISVRDCQLSISLHAPQGLSYAISDFYYAGFALLQDGVIGRQSAYYYFQGSPVPPVESNRTDLRGPYNSGYLFVDRVPVENRVWSPCGVKRDLNVATRVQLFNATPRRAGYMNLAAVDGSAKLMLALATRPCRPEPDLGAGPPRGTDGPGVSAPSRLIGRYFMRTQSHWTSGGGIRGVRDLALAEFVKVGESIGLRIKTCAQVTRLEDYELTLVRPDAYPEVRRTVVIDQDGSWRTDAAPIAVGYQRDGVSRCEGRAGERIAKRSAQRWIRGESCRCPSGPTSVPTLDDCRVEDLDDDGEPGIAYELTHPDDGVVRREHYVGVGRSHPVRGSIDPRGYHTARWNLDEAPYLLRCEPDGCKPREPLDAPCADDFNTVQFVPWSGEQAGDGAWTCGALRASHSRLFSHTTPVSQCAQGDVSFPRR